MADDSTIIYSQGPDGKPIAVGAQDPYAFQQDPLGDRGWLRYPYQVGALIWQYSATLGAWVSQNDVLVFSDSGLGDEDAPGEHRHPTAEVPERRRGG